MQKLFLAFGLSLLTISSSFAAQLETQIVDLNNRTLPQNAVRVPFIQLNLRAVDGPVEINSLTIQRTGLSTNEDFGRLWAETDNYRRTNSRQLNNDDLVELEFRNPLLVTPGNNERLTVYANLEFEGGGRTAQLSVVDIDHSGVEVMQEPEAVAPIVTVKQLPVVTESRSQYDRKNFRISCKNQKCQLVPRN